MTVEILMPALSPTMTEGNLTKWIVKEGDTIKAGDILAEIETDKATMEVEAVDEGVVEKLLVKEGQEFIKVNSPIAILSDINIKITNKKDDIKENDNIELKLEDIDIIKKKDNVEKINDDSIQPKKNEIDIKNENFITMRQALKDAMAEEMRKNQSVFLMGEEVG